MTEFNSLQEVIKYYGIPSDNLDYACISPRNYLCASAFYDPLMGLRLCFKRLDTNKVIKIKNLEYHLSFEQMSDDPVYHNFNPQWYIKLELI